MSQCLHWYFIQSNDLLQKPQQVAITDFHKQTAHMQIKELL